ncbi:MAG: type VI secretion system lipoprotein TssJ [Kangiella sp.]|nr:type VI secretion system lipoprotein TssJ [Kangiella sp.]
MKQLMMVKRVLVAAILLVSVSGCTLLKGNKGEEVELTISVAEEVNQDELGRSSPIVIRLYELKKEVAVEGMDFFSIYDQTEPEFKTAVSSMKEFQVKPGQKLEQLLVTDVSTKYLMLVAAFKDIDNSQWKLVHEIEQSDELTLVIEGKSIVKQ